MGDIPKIPKQPASLPITPLGGPAPTANTSPIDTAALTSNIAQTTNVSGAASQLKATATNGLLLTQLSALGTNIEKALKGSTHQSPSATSSATADLSTLNIELPSGKTIPMGGAVNDFNRLAGIINKRIPNANIPTIPLPLSTSSSLTAPLQAINKGLNSQITTIAQGSKKLSTASTSEMKILSPLLESSETITKSLGHGPALTKKEVIGVTAFNSLQSLGAMSTNELLSLFLMTNINNMKDLVTMLTKASMGFTKYVSACNDLMASMTAAQGPLLSNANDEISNSQTGTYVHEMNNLGFPTASTTKDGNMNSATISANLTTISNGVQLATQKSNQLTTELSQANSMLQKWLQFASNTLQGNSRMASTIYGNF